MPFHGKPGNAEGLIKALKIVLKALWGRAKQAPYKGRTSNSDRTFKEGSFSSPNQ